MLTENDIHYLAGLFLLLSTDSNVRIDLGKLIRDDSINKRRDVDVVLTVTQPNIDAQLYGGFEVKDHRRKLDVTHAEQLGAKLRDMSSLSSRGIVSASGYTAPALAKCEAYGIQPLALQAWVPQESTLDKVSFPQDFHFDCPMMTAHGPVRISYASGSNESVADPSQRERPCSWYGGGVLYQDVKTLGQLNDNLLSTFHEALPQSIKNDLTHEWPIRLNSGLNLELEHRLELDGKSYIIDRVSIDGFFSRRIVKVPADFRALVDARTGECMAGACLAITPSQAIIGMALTKDRPQQPSATHISAEDRNRRVIRNQNLSRG